MKNLHVDDLQKPNVYVRHSSTVLDDDGLEMYATSDLKEISYLRYNNISPLCTRLRTWTSASGPKSKVFVLFTKTQEVTNLLEEMYNGNCVLVEWLKAYDETRGWIRNLAKGSTCGISFSD